MKFTASLSPIAVRCNCRMIDDLAEPSDAWMSLLRLVPILFFFSFPFDRVHTQLCENNDWGILSALNGPRCHCAETSCAAEQKITLLDKVIANLTR